MAYSERGRRTRYDNIAQGAALSSKENTILGNTVSVVEVYGGGTRTSTSNEERDITNISVGTVSTSDAAFQGPENGGVAEDPTDERLG
jgi:hypothetical protein